MALLVNSELARNERKAIVALRRKYKSVPAKTLARHISDTNYDEFKDTDHAHLAVPAARPFLSIYSVIRRFDRRQKAEAILALASDGSTVL